MPRPWPENRLPWPDDADHEARLDSYGLVWHRLKPDGPWQHLNHRDSITTRRVYRFPGERA